MNLFISFESKDESIIYGFCRLRLNESNDNGIDRLEGQVTQVGLKGNDKLRLLPGLQYKFRTKDVDFPDTDYFDFYIDQM